MFGCAGLLASIAFIFGVPFSFFFTVNHWSERFLIAIAPAGLTFIAAVLLFLRDHSSHENSIAIVQALMSTRADTPDDNFIAGVPDSNSEVLLQTRKAIAEFFDVPIRKLRPNDDLRAVLHADKLEPAFQMYVVDSVIAKNTKDSQTFAFGLDGLSTIVDMSAAIEDVLEEFGRS